MSSYKIDLNENLKNNLKLSFSNRLIRFPFKKQTCEVNNTMLDTIKVTKKSLPCDFQNKNQRTKSVMIA